MLILDKIIKKKDLIHDNGVKQHGNHIDILIRVVCIFIVVLLIYLTIRAYAY